MPSVFTTSNVWHAFTQLISAATALAERSPSPNEPSIPSAGRRDVTTPPEAVSGDVTNYPSPLHRMLQSIAHRRVPYQESTVELVETDRSNPPSEALLPPRLPKLADTQWYKLRVDKGIPPDSWIMTPEIPFSMCSTDRLDQIYTTKEVLLLRCWYFLYGIGNRNW